MYKVVVVMFLLSCAGCKERVVSETYDESVLEWRSKFLEFSEAFVKYQVREDFDYMDQEVGSEVKLFPDNFAVISRYGDAKKRYYLKSEDDWCVFQRSVNILENDAEFYHRENMVPGGTLAPKWKILDKVLIQTDGSRVRVALSYRGYVTVEPQ